MRCDTMLISILVTPCLGIHPHWADTPTPTGRRLLQRTVRILLECILVDECAQNVEICTQTIFLVTFSRRLGSKLIRRSLRITKNKNARLEAEI